MIHNIKINEEETYSFDLPQDITLVQLSSIVRRLNSISKLFDKEISPSSEEMVKVVDTNVDKKKERKYGMGRKIPREEVCQRIRFYYTLPIEESKRYFNKIGLKSPAVSINGYIHGHKITPQECGLTAFKFAQ
jgi:hypothetical protein